MRRKMHAYSIEFKERFDEVLNSGELVLGFQNDKFEKEFAKYLGVLEVITVANGTDALYIAIKSLNFPPYSLIGTTANGGGYSTNAILNNNYVPLFVDVNLNTGLISIDSVLELIKSEVKAIVITHLYGQSVPNMHEIVDLCKKNNVFLIEDKFYSVLLWCLNTWHLILHIHF